MAERDRSSSIGTLALEACRAVIQRTPSSDGFARGWVGTAETSHPAAFNQGQEPRKAGRRCCFDHLDPTTAGMLLRGVFETTKRFSYGSDRLANFADYDLDNDRRRREIPEHFADSDIGPSTVERQEDFVTAKPIGTDVSHLLSRPGANFDMRFYFQGGSRPCSDVKDLDASPQMFYIGLK